LDASEGKILWNFTVGKEVASSPAIAGGLVYVGSNDGKIYALDTISGACIWRYSTEGMVVSSPSIANNIVYVGSYNHMLYAFGSLSNKQTDILSFEVLVSLIAAIIAVASVALAVTLYQKKHTRKATCDKTNMCLA
jgi:outer membrane protein assembly factor BamB